MPGWRVRYLAKDWLKWVAAGFALVATASAEYELARAIGMNEFIAAAVPGALDAYVVRALRAHREVLTSVLAMVGVNAASHLVTAGLLDVDWKLITAVSAIAPLVLWRVHALSTPGEARRRVLWGVRAQPEPDEHERTEEEDERAYEHPGPLDPDERARTDEHTVNVGPVTSEWDAHMKDVPGLGDYMPVEWSTPPLPVRAPGASRGGHVPEWPSDGDSTLCIVCAHAVVYDGEDGWLHPDDSDCVRARPEPVLPTVPDLPAGYEHAVLSDADRAYLERARVLDSEHRSEHGEHVPVRVLKSVLGVGTPRAQRLRDALREEES